MGNHLYRAGLYWQRQMVNRHTRTACLMFSTEVSTACGRLLCRSATRWNVYSSRI